MASTNVGDQEITFKYQQEGTAKSFNKLLHGVIPTGIISGGKIIKQDSGSTVNIQPMEMIISDSEVTIHVKTNEYASVVVSTSTPYVVATFDWMDVVNNFVTFQAVSYTTLRTMNNVIIFGKCEMEGDNVLAIDETRRSDASSSNACNHDFQYETEYRGKSSSFRVTSLEDNTLGFNIGEGKAIINGKTVEFTSQRNIELDNEDSDSPLYFNGNISNGRTDIIILKDDGNIEYIMGRDIEESVHLTPRVPNYGLLLATVSVPSGIQNIIKGSWINNVYNNNYISNSPTFGIEKNGTVENPHTLYI